jgi:hypothetical protein
VIIFSVECIKMKLYISSFDVDWNVPGGLEWCGNDQVYNQVLVRRLGGLNVVNVLFSFFKKKCSFKGLLDTICLESGEPFTARARAVRCASKSLSGACKFGNSTASLARDRAQI